MSALRWLTTTVMRGSGWTRCMAHTGRNAVLPVAPALGVVFVEVAQIQFLDDEMVGYLWACCLVRQWMHGLRQLLGACGWFFHTFYVVVFSDPQVASAHSCCFSCFPTPATLGHWTLRLRAPCIWQFPWSLLGCTLQVAMLGSTVDT